ncbi:MAG: AMP-binding protein, partial [Actinobacteria bacterium]|nr:AMP-binding protein [Actinomycetota bacterium]
MRGDLEWGTLPGLAAEAAKRFGSRDAVVDGDVTLTFADLNDAAQQAARAFLASGIQPGDRVGIWAPNCHQWVTAMAGLHAAGAVIVPVNTRFKGAEAAHVLNTAGAKLVLTVGEFLGADYVAMLRDAGVGTDTVRLDSDEWLTFLDGAEKFD